MMGHQLLCSWHALQRCTCLSAYPALWLMLDGIIHAVPVRPQDVSEERKLKIGQVSARARHQAMHRCLELNACTAIPVVRTPSMLARVQNMANMAEVNASIMICCACACR